MILLTGAGGMLGSYLKQEFSDREVISLGKGEDNNFVCDLRSEVPDFRDREFDLVIHCAGTEEEGDADALNYHGTMRLIEAMKGHEPAYFVFVSSHTVYGEAAGEEIDEEGNIWAPSEVGKSKARAEKFLREWANECGVTLTILRPAYMFGNGVKGKMHLLFREAVNGTYIHIRGNDARLSLVTAYDVARGIRRVYEEGGIFNAADGSNPRLIDLAEAMTANAGGKKRMTHLPLAWAEWIWRTLRFIPMIDRNLHPLVVEKRMQSKTISGAKFANAAGIEYFNTIEVIERISPHYPYTFLSGEESK